MKKVCKLFSIVFLGAVLFVSCSKDDDMDNGPGLPEGEFQNGVFVLNEGNFGAANASISFIDSEGVLHQNIYQAVNGTNLGDTAQSIAFEDDKAYIIMNGSNTIEVVNRYTFEHIATISNGIMSPRAIVFENGKGYVSNWGDPGNPDDDFIAVLNLSSHEVELSIPVDEGPEKIVKDNGRLYVAHKGGYGYGNAVSVINFASGSLLTTIPVADVPDSMEKNNGFLYVLSSGKQSWTGEETNGALTKINLSDNSIVETSTFDEGLHPTHLKIENNVVYYTVDGDIYRKDIDATLPQAPLFSVAEQGVYGIYGFEVLEDKIYVADAKDFSSNGEIFLYSLSGNMLSRHDVGVLPNGFYRSE